MLRLAWLLFTLLILPNTAFAAFFDVPTTDKSMGYLASVFGQIGSVLISADSGNYMFSSFVQILNKVIFGLGVIIVVYTGIFSAVHTAHEGEVMGKKWSTIWVPVRASFGLYLLLPTSTGYCYMQIAIMYFITQSIGAANAIWDQVLFNLVNGQTLSSVPSTNPSALDSYNYEPDIKHLLAAAMCTNAMNNDPYFNPKIDDVSAVRLFTSLDGSQLIWGRQTAGGGEENICGAINIPSFSKQTYKAGQDNQDPAPLRNIFITGIQNIDYLMQTVAQEYNDTALAQNDEKALATGITTSNLIAAVDGLKQMWFSINGYYAATNTQDATLLKARADGWITTGQYYFLLVQGSAAAQTPPAPTLLTFITPPTEGDGPLNKSDLDARVDAGIAAAQDIYGLNLYKKAAATNQETQTVFEEVSEALNDVIKPLIDPFVAIVDTAKDVVNALVNPMGVGYNVTGTGGTPQDPLVAMTIAGQTMMNVVETSFWSLMLIAMAAALFGAPPCANPIGYAVLAAVIFFAILLMLVGSLFWSAGVLLGLYIPIIPWLFFTFAAIGWIILVIEAIIAAPLVALILIVPSEDELGKAGHSLVILTGLIFRPSLMVIGFLFAIKLLYVSVNLLTYGFYTMINSPKLSMLSGIGFFGSIALVVTYVGIVLIVVNQSFSLIYLLPDKVMRWMGESPENQDISSKVEQIKGSAETGGGVGGEMMKQGTGGAMKMISKAG